MLKEEGLVGRPRVALILMAKAPEAGRVKTRLCPPLSLDEAAELSRCFLLDTIERVRQVPEAAPVIAHDPPESGLAFATVAPDFALIPQRGHDLGARMAQVVGAVLERGAGGAVVIGGDAPNLPVDHLRRAVGLIAEGGHDVVLGPSQDGGYYLIGLRSLHDELFDAMAWSTAEVFDETLARCRRLQLRVARLPAWYDVDSAAALARLEADLGRDEGRDAPRTWRFLAARRP
jgi:uncharacterized protein